MSAGMIAGGGVETPVNENNDEDDHDGSRGNTPLTATTTKAATVTAAAAASSLLLTSLVALMLMMVLSTTKTRTTEARQEITMTHRDGANIPIGIPCGSVKGTSTVTHSSTPDQTSHSTPTPNTKHQQQLDLTSCQPRCFILLGVFRCVVVVVYASICLIPIWDDDDDVF